MLHTSSVSKFVNNMCVKKKGRRESEREREREKEVREKEN